MDKITIRKPVSGKIDNDTERIIDSIIQQVEELLNDRKVAKTVTIGEVTLNFNRIGLRID